MRFLLTLAVALAVGFGMTSRALAASHVNVIIILADDLGYGDLGCYGHPRFKTPHLDRMAGEGARLTNFYTCTPYCAPSRAALQTGRYPFRCRVTQNPCPDAGVNDVGIPADEVTLGEAFQAAGYRTACIGKWHLGHRPNFYPTRNGYHEYFGILYSNDMHPVELIEGEKVVEYPVYQATLTKRYTDRAVEFIERNKDRPFFLYLPHAMPHKPLAASEDFYTKSGSGLYGDVIAELDWSVGKILTQVKEAGLDANTLVFFTSDNGPWYGGSTGGLRGMKGRTWEGGLRVPLIARWPGRIPAGHVSDEPAIMMDLFTTSLRAANVALPRVDVLDGKDILPLLTSNAKSPHSALFGMMGDPIHCVRSGTWKLHVRAPGPKVEKAWRPDEKWVDPRRPDGVRIIAPYEQAHPSQYPGRMTGDPFTGIALFDLGTDPGEQRDLSKTHPEVVERLRGYVQALRPTEAATTHQAR